MKCANCGHEKSYHENQNNFCLILQRVIDLKDITEEQKNKYLDLGITDGYFCDCKQFTNLKVTSPSEENHTPKVISDEITDENLGDKGGSESSSDNGQVTGNSTLIVPKDASDSPQTLKDKIKLEIPFVFEPNGFILTDDVKNFLKELKEESKHIKICSIKNMKGKEIILSEDLCSVKDVELFLSKIDKHSGFGGEE